MGFTTTIRPDPDRMAARAAAWPSAMRAQFRPYMAREAARVLPLFVQEAPKKSGRFVRAMRARTLIFGGNDAFQVTAPHPLRLFIQRGTRPHIIRPRRARSLAFYWERVGKFMILGQVNHPGTKANDYVSRAVRRWLPGAVRRLAKVTRDVTIKVFE